MKTLTKTKNQKQKNQQQQRQRQNSKQCLAGPKSSNTVAAITPPEPEHEQEPEERSGYEGYYQQLAEEAEAVERHVRELRQTPGLEHLTEAEAQAQVDFMLRFSAWVFNQHLQEQLAATLADEDEIALDSVKVSKVQMLKGKSNKKVTESLSL